MKYIYERNEYQKLNEIVDSDKLEVEFGDTLIGGTLHRLLGVGRSALKNVEIEQYAKKLDRILAGMVVEPSLSEINQGKEELTLRMNDAYVRSHSPSKLIEVIANGNRSIIDIKIDDEIYTDKEQFEDELVITLNKVLDLADIMYQEELKVVMKANMPSIPGLDGLLD